MSNKPKIRDWQASIGSHVRMRAVIPLTPARQKTATAVFIKMLKEDKTIDDYERARRMFNSGYLKG